MTVRTPKNLQIPNIEVLQVDEDLKRWLRNFTDRLTFYLRTLRSDAVEIAAGDWEYLAGGSEGVDGSWRFGIDGTSAVLEKRVSGTWETHHEWEFTDA